MNFLPSTPSDLCPHFGPCGGCSVQNLSPHDYKAFKLNKILNPLHRTLDNITQIQIHSFESVSPASRRRVILKAQRLAKTVILGFYQRQSHHIVDLKTCLIAVPEIERCMAPLRTFLTQLLPSPSKAEIFILKCDQGLDIAIESASLMSLSLAQRELSAEFAEVQKLARLTLHHDPVYIKHKPTILLGGCLVEVTPYAFLQASQESDQWLADKVLSYIPQNIIRIADLFCGRGTLSLPLSQHFSVDAYEFDQDALKALSRTAEINQRPIKTFQRQLYNDPLQTIELKPYQLVVINPPRDGAYAQIKQLALSQVSCVIYISCNPKTFTRDAKVLVEKNFQLTDLFPFDQFLWSDHMELVAIFDKS